jgi:hypothetical protein
MLVLLAMVVKILGSPYSFIYFILSHYCQVSIFRNGGKENDAGPARTAR